MASSDSGILSLPTNCIGQPQAQQQQQHQPPPPPAQQQQQPNPSLAHSPSAQSQQSMGAAILAKLDSITRALNNVEGTVANLTGQVDALTEDIGGLRGEVASAWGELKSLQKELRGEREPEVQLTAQQIAFLDSMNLPHTAEGLTKLHNLASNIMSTLKPPASATPEPAPPTPAAPLFPGLSPGALSALAGLANGNANAIPTPSSSKFSNSAAPQPPSTPAGPYPSVLAPSAAALPSSQPPPQPPQPRRSVSTPRSAPQLSRKRKTPPPAEPNKGSGPNGELTKEENEMSYRLCQTHTTVAQLWEEWTVGINGGPSVEYLERTYSTKWRPTPATRQYYYNRRTIIEEINRIADRLDESLPLEERQRMAVEELDKTRSEGFGSLDWLIKHIKDKQFESGERKRKVRKSKDGEDASGGGAEGDNDGPFAQGRHFTPAAFQSTFKT